METTRRPFNEVQAHLARRLAIALLEGMIKSGVGFDEMDEAIGSGEPRARERFMALADGGGSEIKMGDISDMAFAMGMKLDFTATRPKGEDRSEADLLELEIDMLRAALKPFADEGIKWEESCPDEMRPHCDLGCCDHCGESTGAELASFTAGDLRRAAALFPLSEG